MRPELSLSLLTVFAGAGQGLFIMIVAFDMVLPDKMGLGPNLLYSAGIVSIILPLIGMAASTFHLGNPQRGWKAVLMWKNSWLTREIILLPAFLAVDAIYLLCKKTGTFEPFIPALGVLGIVISLALYLSSAMVYVHIKFIREWASPYTVINFIVFGLTSGLAVLAGINSFFIQEVINLRYMFNLLIILAIISLVLKVLTYRYNAGLYVAMDIKKALGINSPDIQLMDMGTSYDHYNTLEYSYPIDNIQMKRSSIVVLIVAFALPLLLWMMALFLSFGPLYFMAAVLMIFGLVLERRLFFIQGNHVQNLYYGRFKSNEAKNPLFAKTTKSYPG